MKHPAVHERWLWACKGSFDSRKTAGVPPFSRSHREVGNFIVNVVSFSSLFIWIEPPWDSVALFAIAGPSTNVTGDSISASLAFTGKGFKFKSRFFLYPSIRQNFIAFDDDGLETVRRRKGFAEGRPVPEMLRIENDDIGNSSAR